MSINVDSIATVEGYIDSKDCRKQLILPLILQHIYHLVIYLHYNKVFLQHRQALGVAMLVLRKSCIVTFFCICNLLNIFNDRCYKEFKWHLKLILNNFASFIPCCWTWPFDLLSYWTEYYITYLGVIEYHITMGHTNSRQVI